ncbi:hypothetical protein [Nisaea sp.]|uniref:hypothetical protein n=1 Tax=Nisaea sp. TaxID=2024842 RepID=UPI0032970CAD
MPIYGPRLISDLRANWTPLPGEDLAEDRKTNRNMARFKDEDLTRAVEAVFPGGVPDKHPLDVTAIGLLGYWSGVRDGASSQRKYMASHAAEGHRMAIAFALQSLAPRAEAARIWEEAQRIESETKRHPDHEALT